MRKLLIALGLAIGVVAPVAAHASPVTYDLVLHNLNGNVAGGTGAFTITGAPSGPATSDTTLNGGLTALSFSIGGDTFDLSNAVSNYGEVDFQGTTLISVVYNGGVTQFNPTIIFSLNAGSLFYNFSDVIKGENSQGTITYSIDAGTQQTAVTPEPSSLVLLGSGILGLAGVTRRKFLS